MEKIKHWNGEVLDGTILYAGWPRGKDVPIGVDLKTGQVWEGVPELGMSFCGVVIEVSRIPTVDNGSQDQWDRWAQKVRDRYRMAYK